LAKTSGLIENCARRWKAEGNRLLKTPDQTETGERRPSQVALFE